MAVSRIAHYLKAMMRDKVGSFASAGNVEAFLMSGCHSMSYLTMVLLKKQKLNTRYVKRL